ncbi:MAG: hypothetical protein J6T15_03940 [Bacilli bacterium]|nr:hypothetical protein [Bacilli bacterium]
MIYGLYDDDDEDRVLGWYSKDELLKLIQEQKPKYSRNNLNCFLSLLRNHRIDGIKYRGKTYKVYELKDFTIEELMEKRNEL